MGLREGRTTGSSDVTEPALDRLLASSRRSRVAALTATAVQHLPDEGERLGQRTRVERVVLEILIGEFLKKN